MTGLSKSNWNQPSDKKLKLIADIALYSLPLYLSAIMASPMRETTKAWINFAITIMIISFKVFTKFSKDDNKD